MSFRMNVLRKAISISKKSDSNAAEKKKKKDIKSVVVNKDYFREINDFLKKFVLRHTFHNIEEISGVKCHKLQINPSKKYFRQTKQDDKKLLLYIHGGGFCRGFALHGIYYMKAMMKRLGCEAICVDYSLSPENIYPTALNELVAVYKELIKTHSPESIILTGESAGANLALALLMYLRDHKIPMPYCGVLVSGYYNLNNDTSSYIINKDSDICLSKEILDLMAMTYIKGDYCSIPNELCNQKYVSPAFSSFKGLPPIMFTVCSDELLYEDTAMVYSKSKQVNPKSSLYVDKNCFHAYIVMGDTTPESKKACNEIEKFIKSL